jgi:hypothetical protein
VSERACRLDGPAKTGQLGAPVPRTKQRIDRFRRRGRCPHIQAALSERIYDGPAQKVQDLFIRDRQEDTIKVSMEDLPDTQNPDATPDIFWMTKLLGG